MDKEKLKKEPLLMNIKMNKEDFQSWELSSGQCEKIKDHKFNPVT